MRLRPMTKIAIITDTHFGARKGSQVLHDYFERFYSETFFPELDKRGVDTVLHMGDVFDVRKGIDYWSLDWAKRVVFDPLRERNIDTRIIVGNHDIFYKQSLKINSPGLNLTEYTNVTTYADPQTINLKGEEVFLIPWVCEENAEEFIQERDSSKAKYAFGHLEIAGFYANATYLVQHGMDITNFSQFEHVFSGHFHKKNSSGNVTYLGNPYQMYWNDEGDTRGFHIFDLKTGELEFIPNPNNLFNKIYYKEGKLLKPTQYRDTYIKVIVEEKSTPQKLTAFIDKLYKIGVHDIKVIENYDLSVDDDVEIESEDTLTTLAKYVEAMDEDINKESIIEIFKSLYVEAQEV